MGAGILLGHFIDFWGHFGDVADGGDGDNVGDGGDGDDGGDGNNDDCHIWSHPAIHLLCRLRRRHQDRSLRTAHTHCLPWYHCPQYY